MGGEQRSLQKIRLIHFLNNVNMYLGVSRPRGQARPSGPKAGAGGRGPSRDSSITFNESLLSNSILMALVKGLPGSILTQSMALMEALQRVLLDHFHKVLFPSQPSCFSQSVC